MKNQFMPIIIINRLYLSNIVYLHHLIVYMYMAVILAVLN